MSNNTTHLKKRQHSHNHSSEPPEKKSKGERPNNPIIVPDTREHQNLQNPQYSSSSEPEDKEAMEEEVGDPVPQLATSQRHVRAYRSEVGNYEINQTSQTSIYTYGGMELVSLTQYNHVSRILDTVLTHLSPSIIAFILRGHQN